MNEDQVEEVMKLPEVSESMTGTEEVNPEDLPKVTEQEAHKPEDIAAAFFRLERVKFEMLLSKMAPYQIRRAIMNAVSYPFVDDEYLPETEEEKQFAYLVHELMLNKTIMTLSFEMQEAEKAMKSQELSSNLPIIDETNLLEKGQNDEKTMQIMQEIVEKEIIKE